MPQNINISQKGTLLAAFFESQNPYPVMLQRSSPSLDSIQANALAPVPGNLELSIAERFGRSRSNQWQNNLSPYTEPSTYHYR